MPGYAALLQKSTDLYTESQTDQESRVSHNCKIGKEHPDVPGLDLSLSQMKNLLSVLGYNNGPVLHSTSHQKQWPPGEGLGENDEDEKKSRKHDLCYEKRLKKMRLFS